MKCSNVIITIDLNIEYQNVGEGGGDVTMYFVIYKPRIFPQLSKIAVDNEKQKHLSLILRSKRVVSAFASCSYFCQGMKYLWNFVTNNGVCINLNNFEL